MTPKVSSLSPRPAIEQLMVKAWPTNAAGRAGARDDKCFCELQYLINEQPTTTNEQRPTNNDQRSTINDQRSTTNDQRPTTNDQRSTDNDQRSTTNDQRSPPSNPPLPS